MHPMMKFHTGFLPNSPDDVVEGYWNHFSKHVFKPCFVLDWCPYGPLVEDFPLDPDDLQGWELHDGVTPVACEVFGHMCPAYFSAEPMLDPTACESLPPSMAGCERCPVDCARPVGEPSEGCGDPLCRTCFTTGFGHGVATIGCSPPSPADAVRLASEAPVPASTREEQDHPRP